MKKLRWLNVVALVGSGLVAGVVLTMWLAPQTSAEDEILRSSACRTVDGIAAVLPRFDYTGADEVEERVSFALHWIESDPISEELRASTFGPDLESYRSEVLIFFGRANASGTLSRDEGLRDEARRLWSDWRCSAIERHPRTAWIAD